MYPFDRSITGLLNNNSQTIPINSDLSLRQVYTSHIPGEMAIVTSTINVYAYIVNLDNFLTPSIEAFGNEVVFQNDKASSHKFSLAKIHEIIEIASI